MRIERVMFAGLAACAAAPGLAQAPPAPLQGARLDIVAEGEVSRAPDLVTIGAGVVTQAATAADAMRDNARRMAATVAALRKAGVADRDIQSSAIALNPQYRYGDNVPPTITGYQASNQVTVRFRDIARAGAILDALVAAGANQINGPSFALDKPAAALDEARRAAIAIARARAELYARAAGLKVRRIVSISEGGGSAMPPPPMPRMMAMQAKAEDTPVQAGEQTLSVTVSVSFELE